MMAMLQNGTISRGEYKMKMQEEALKVIHYYFFFFFFVISVLSEEKPLIAISMHTTREIEDYKNQ